MELRATVPSACTVNKPLDSPEEQYFRINISTRRDGRGAGEGPGRPGIKTSGSRKEKFDRQRRSADKFIAFTFRRGIFFAKHESPAKKYFSSGGIYFFYGAPRGRKGTGGIVERNAGKKYRPAISGNSPDVPRNDQPAIPDNFPEGARGHASPLPSSAGDRQFSFGPMRGN